MIKGKIFVKYIPYADNYSLLNLNWWLINTFIHFIVIELFYYFTTE